MPLLALLEERGGAAPIRPTEPVQYVIVAIEHDRKYIPPHASISLLDDTLYGDCKATKAMAWRIFGIDPPSDVLEQSGTHKGQ